MDEDVILERNLTKAEALLVFEWLSENSEKNILQNKIGDEATYWAFERLLACLEKTLAEPFKQNYSELVETASQHILKKHGGL